MGSELDSPVATWSAPQCPFTVEYSLRVLDDIRLAVVDAFFSLPHGGAEIGGLLLGDFRKGCLRINDYAPLECEHASGPSFTLSERDLARMAALVAEARRNGADRQPVGWYHSHTRSEILLSGADEEIHRRFFQEPWQVALVLRPHTFHPTRAGFFFRRPDGSIGADGPAGEITLAPLGVKPAPAGSPPVPEAAAQNWRERKGRGPVITLTAEQPQPAAAAVSSAPPSPAAAPERQPALESVPKFLETEPPRSRLRLRLLLAAGIVLAAAAGAFATRGAWLPRLAALRRPVPVPAPVPAPVSVGLNAIDIAGQLQIRWDRGSPPIRGAESGVLVITDGPATQAIELDPAHLQTGVFTYARQGARVDVNLSVRLPGGREAREATSFLGRLPAESVPAEDPRVRKQREDLAQQAAKLKSDLNAQTARTRKLERSLEDVKTQLRQQQQRRLQNQDAGK